MAAEPTAEFFKARWRDAISGLGGDAARAAAAGTEILAAYRAPERRYHDARHLAALLTRLERWADRAADPPTLAFAAFLHDAVYEGRPGADEAASAEWAEQLGVALALDAERIARASFWIRATAGHAPQPDNDGRLFLDADLEILAAPEPAYDAYAAAIRAEYAAVPEAMFRAGRKTALQSFLGRERIYTHERTPTMWEAAARANIQREIAAL